MPGIKGSGGPPPKRTEQRRRTNQPAKGPAEKAPTEPPICPPGAPEWYPGVLAWYDSLARSGQSAFYTNSDWATAWMLADSLSREMQPQPIVVGAGKDAHVEMHAVPPKAATLAAWLKGCASLMATEGDRRRLRLELEQSKPAEEAPNVSRIDDARSRLRSG